MPKKPWGYIKDTALHWLWGPSAGLTLVPPEAGMQDTRAGTGWPPQHQAPGRSCFSRLAPSLSQHSISHAHLFFWGPHATSHPSSPIFSNLVDVDDVVSLSYGNFSGIRRESHAFYHVALPAVLGVKTKIMSINERQTNKQTNTCLCQKTRRLILRKSVDHFPCLRLEGRLPSFLG